jgi:hypothetical protein
MEDVLPGNIDTLGDVERREMDWLAKSGAGRMFDDLSVAQRVALLANELNVFLANPLVEKAAGCKKSAISDAWHLAVSEIEEKVSAKFRDDDLETVHILAQLTLGVVKHIFLWSVAEKRYAHLLTLRRERKGL